ncbi:hypothetical protein DPMN_157616 [Dreissena polymorpha]|uniref:Uncharacterized protein n=1 Tax=Dreissena polymorpha TaxID=45954 RepID=A0A9D4IMF6_DREPO|nr:hypothetical protein DPMN_157616 [Dreissena polymorpha]
MATVRQYDGDNAIERWRHCDDTTATSPGPSRFANAGRPARSGMICRFFLTRSHYFPQPGRVPVNPGLATVYPVVVAGSVHAEPRYTVTPPTLTGAIPASYPGRATATPRFNHGGAPVNAAISGLSRHSPGLHRGKTGDNRGVAVALRGSVRAPVELRCRPGCSRCLVPGEAPVHPGRARITHRGSAGIIVRLGLKKSTSQYLY